MGVDELARGPQDHEQDTLEQLLIPETLLTQIAEYCKVDRKFERCGLIGGRGEQAFTFYPTANIAEDAASRYLIDPKDQLSAFKSMRANREELLGIVHSHPNSPPLPSPTDVALATYPGVAYLILSLRKPTEEYACFLFKGTGFRKLPITKI